MQQNFGTKNITNLNVTREQLLNLHLYKKVTRKMLMKLTLSCINTLETFVALKSDFMFALETKKCLHFFMEFFQDFKKG